MRGIDIKAVLLGTALGLLLDLVAGTFLVVLFTQGAVPAGATEEDTQRILAAIAGQAPFQFVSLVLGALTTVAAGHAAARMAGRLPYMNAAAVGVIGIVLGALLAEGSLPPWFNLIGFASILPCALYGGHLAKRRLDDRGA